MKHLYKSRTNKKWDGILGGLGVYMNVDPTFLRVLFILLVLCTGIVPGVIAYIIAIFIIPEEPTITPTP